MHENTKPNIILIGMTGSSKSTVGRILGKKLGVEFFDADREYVKKHGEKIADTFARLGEQVFRNRETVILKELAKKQGAVIACGGGAVLREENMTALKQSGTVVLLYADIDTIYSRIGRDKNRPVTNGKSKEELAALYEKRKPLYLKYGDFTVDNTRLTPEQTADKVLEYFGKE